MTAETGLLCTQKGKLVTVSGRIMKTIGEGIILTIIGNVHGMHETESHSMTRIYLRQELAEGRYRVNYVSGAISDGPAPRWWGSGYLYYAWGLIPDGNPYGFGMPIFSFGEHPTAEAVEEACRGMHRDIFISNGGISLWYSGYDKVDDNRGSVTIRLTRIGDI